VAVDHARERLQQIDAATRSVDVTSEELKFLGGF
jgi:hypothetical protein